MTKEHELTLLEYLFDVKSYCEEQILYECSKCCLQKVCEVNFETPPVLWIIEKNVV